MTTAGTRPQRLAANKVPVYYAGGAGIDRFRGSAGAAGPEDWVGSVTAFPPGLLPAGANPATGISPLPDGSLLSEAVATDPSGWLGDELAARFGTEPGLLVKLLDAGERLPVHAHPDRATAAARLGSRFGKTEGWIIMASAPGAEIWLGFARPVDPDELRRWVAAGDVEAMLAAMNRLPVTEGDVFFLPAGLPHSIGPGVLLTELQEPTSFSLLAEYEPFGLTEEQATLGLGWDDALACFDLAGYDPSAPGDLRPGAVPVSESSGGRVLRLFPAAAEPFFQAYRAVAHGALALGEPGFRVVVVLVGRVMLGWRDGEAEVRSGETWVVPHGAGPLTLRGEADAILCAPPAALA